MVATSTRSLLIHLDPDHRSALTFLSLFVAFFLSRGSPPTGLPARHVASQVPLGKPLQQDGVDLAVRLHEDRLIRVHTSAQIAALVQEVIGPPDVVAEGFEARGRVRRRHDDVHLVSLGLDE